MGNLDIIIIYSRGGIAAKQGGGKETGYFSEGAEKLPTTKCMRRAAVRDLKLKANQEGTAIRYNHTALQYGDLQQYEELSNHISERFSAAAQRRRPGDSNILQRHCFVVAEQVSSRQPVSVEESGDGTSTAQYWCLREPATVATEQRR